MAEPLTQAEIAAIAERVEKATAGPWTGDPEPYAIYIYGADGSPVADTTVPGKYGDGDPKPDPEDGARGGVDAVLRLRGVGASKHRPDGSLEANYAFMIHAREDVPRLLATIRELDQERAKYKSAGDAVDRMMKLVHELRKENLGLSSDRAYAIAMMEAATGQTMKGDRFVQLPAVEGDERHKGIVSGRRIAASAMRAVVEQRPRLTLSALRETLLRLCDALEGEP